MEELKDTFKIDNDKAADWAIAQIREHESERDRLIALAEEQIKDLTDRIQDFKIACDNNTKYLKSCLIEYFDKVPTKETKTQKSYKLISGTLVFKKPTVKINHNDDQLIKNLDGTEFVEIKKSLKWGEYKKNLVIEGDCVIDSTTGEVVEGCTVEDVPPSFNIKF